jgi:hypothetical protein
MSRSHREPCGCRSNDSTWLELCATHQAEFAETHQRWQAEHVERQQQKEKPHGA